jgi:hypothetical protein
VIATLAFTACHSGVDNTRPPATPTVASSTEVPAPTPIPPSPTPAIGAATLTVLPAPTGITAGQTFRLTLRIGGVTDLGAYQVTPVFDASVLELISVSDTGFLGSTGRVATCANDGAQPTAVPTSFCVTTGASPGPSGDGNLALIEFRALAPGTAEVTVRATVTTPDGRDIPLTIVPATVTVQ